MKTRTRIKVPNYNAGNYDAIKLGIVCDALGSIGLPARYVVKDKEEGAPVFIEINVPGDGNGSIELLKLKKYIF